MIHTETYLVKFWYQKEEGFWAYQEENIKIPLENGQEDTEKDNHDHASKIIEDRYPVCRVTSVIYI